MTDQNSGSDDGHLAELDDFDQSTCKEKRCFLRGIAGLLIKVIRLLKHRRFGLAEIKTEIIDILDLLTHKKFGLKEIKREIRDIEDKLNGVANVITTGPVSRNAGVGSIVIKVLNNSHEEQTVVVTVYDITKCEKEVDSIEQLTIDAKCAETIIVPAPLQYEVEVSGVVPGIFVWTAARLAPVPPPLAASRFVAANTFRHHEFVPQVCHDSNT